MTDGPNARVIDLEPLSLSPKEAGRLLGVSRNHVYDLVNRLELPAKRSGARIVVDYQAVLAYYDRMPPVG